MKQTLWATILLTSLLILLGIMNLRKTSGSPETEIEPVATKEGNIASSSTPIEPTAQERMAPSDTSEPKTQDAIDPPPLPAVTNPRSPIANTKLETSESVIARAEASWEKAQARVQADKELWVNSMNKNPDARFHPSFAREFYGLYSGTMHYQAPTDEVLKSSQPTVEGRDKIEISFQDFESGRSANEMLIEHLAPTQGEYNVGFALANVGTNVASKVLNVVIPHWLANYRLSHFGFKLPLGTQRGAPLTLDLFGFDSDYVWKKIGTITLEKH